MTHVTDGERGGVLFAVDSFHNQPINSDEEREEGVFKIATRWDAGDGPSEWFVDEVRELRAKQQCEVRESAAVLDRDNRSSE